MFCNELFLLLFSILLCFGLIGWLLYTVLVVERLNLNHLLFFDHIVIWRKFPMLCAWTFWWCFDMCFVFGFMWRKWMVTVYSVGCGSWTICNGLPLPTRDELFDLFSLTFILLPFFHILHPTNCMHRDKLLFDFLKIVLYFLFFVLWFIQTAQR